MGDDDLLEGLNPVQHEAVTHTEGPLLVVAGAGSGKTRVLTHRIAHLIRDHGVSPFEILAITFTNKAADEMKQRVAALVGPVAAEDVGLDVPLGVRAHPAPRRPSRSATRRRSRSTTRPTPCGSPATCCATSTSTPKRFPPRSVHAAISAAKNELVVAGRYAERARQTSSSAGSPRSTPSTRPACCKAGAMDFDDLLVNTVELFRRHPDVLEHYQQRFRHVLVDEYQDTNRVQNELVLLLAAEHRNVCVVGDGDQSIYRFRGADIRNILEFEEAFPDATVVVLEQNYRSTQTILDAANAVIANNVGRKPKELWTDAGPRRAHRPLPRRRRERRGPVGRPRDRAPPRRRRPTAGATWRSSTAPTRRAGWSRST